MSNPYTQHCGASNLWNHRRLLAQHHRVAFWLLFDEIINAIAAGRVPGSFPGLYDERGDMCAELASCCSLTRCQE